MKIARKDIEARAVKIFHQIYPQRNWYSNFATFNGDPEKKFHYDAFMKLAEDIIRSEKEYEAEINWLENRMSC